MHGSYFFQGFNFFPERLHKAKFHYKVIKQDIRIPKSEDFRSGYYFKSNDDWFYERKLSGITLKMRFNTISKTFYFNNAALTIPFKIAGISPAGKHVADIIAIDLMLNKYVVLYGSAYKKDKKVVILIRPSLTGKSSQVIIELKKNAQYIAEDVLVLNPKNNVVYPTIALSSNFGRSINRELYKLALERKMITKQKINKLEVLKLSEANTKKNIRQILQNYYLLNSLIFLNNGFSKAYIAEGNLSKYILNSSIDFQYEKMDLFLKPHANRTNINVKHWNSLGSKYDDVWKSPGKLLISSRELKYIEDSFIMSSARVLDVGIGTGRITGHMSSIFPNSKFYGIDISPEMIKYTQKKFSTAKNVKKLAVCDVSRTDLPYRGKFDVITAIRIFKYSENWKDIILGLSNKLKPEGTMIFTMPNKRSINRFAKYDIKYERTTISELKKLAHKASLEIIDIRTFSRIPDAFYELSSNSTYNNILIRLETIGNILGPAFLGRILFISLRKSSKK
jgi:ubiquinone/menaquinone biosynthesis C-methylase UbiE